MLTGDRLMLNFNHLHVNTFLSDYWQKKPLVLRQALPGFVNLITADELAGLAMEEEIESRIVIETPKKSPYWHLKRGPFLEADFQSLPKTHWTLLVQGVDRFVPELARLFDHFNFIPQWRIDDLMISYAAEYGSVGPHYDNYDVFLYQAQGSRKWSLTTKLCQEDNYLPDVPLRIMQQFDTEEEYVLHAGDMLYLPAHIGHYGSATHGDCMTYSFGYRSYTNQEFWDSFGDYCSEINTPKALYRDPDWTSLRGASDIPADAWKQAKKSMLALLDDDQKLQSWFGRFATQLDEQAHSLLPEPLDEPIAVFIEELTHSVGLTRNAFCRFACLEQTDTSPLCLFINSTEWDTQGVSDELIRLIAYQRTISIAQLKPWLEQARNQQFLYDLWNLQWLETQEE
jgi:50S ribosomal protein L16 3-hydroxylase